MEKRKSRNKKKTCLIVATDFNYNDKRFLKKNYDILSLEINHQLFLKNLGIPFITIEQLYNYQHKINYSSNLIYL